MVVTWVTMHTSIHPIVEFGINSFSSRVSANTTRFVDGGAEKRHFYVHRALLTALKPSQKYRQFCGKESITDNSSVSLKNTDAETRTTRALSTHLWPKQREAIGVRDWPFTATSATTTRNPCPDSEPTSTKGCTTRFFTWETSLTTCTTSAKN